MLANSNQNSTTGRDIKAGDGGRRHYRRSPAPRPAGAKPARARECSWATGHATTGSPPRSRPLTRKSVANTAGVSGSAEDQPAGEHAHHRGQEGERGQARGRDTPRTSQNQARRYDTPATIAAWKKRLAHTMGGREHARLAHRQRERRQHQRRHAELVGSVFGRCAPARLASRSAWSPPTAPRRRAARGRPPRRPRWRAKRFSPKSASTPTKASAMPIHRRLRMCSRWQQPDHAEGDEEGARCYRKITPREALVCRPRKIIANSPANSARRAGRA